MADEIPVCAACLVPWTKGHTWDDHDPMCANRHHQWAFTITRPRQDGDPPPEAFAGEDA